jgi:hypothetical protein
MSSLDSLTHALAAQPSLEAAITLLVDTLADRIKSTSNDQNIQKLARELKATAPALVSAIANKPATLTTA